MAYSSNPITVERMRPFLQPLAEKRECIWRTAPGKSKWLAYKIREALKIAREHPDMYPEFIWTDRLQIRNPSSTEVEAVIKPETLVEVDVRYVEPQTGTTAARMDTTEVLGVEDIARRWEQLKHIETKVYFPSAGLDAEQLLELYAWAQAEGVIFFENAGALTLLRHDPETAEFAWTPDDLEEEL